METITEDNMMTGSQGKGQGHAADNQNSKAPAGKVMDEPEEPVVLRRSILTSRYTYILVSILTFYH